MPGSQPPGYVHDLRAVIDGQDRRNHVADHPAGEDRQHKVAGLHLEHPGREDEEFPGRGRGQDRRDQHGEEFLFFEAIQQLLVAGAVDSFHEEQLPACPAEQERNQAAQRRSNRRNQDVEVEMLFVGPNIPGDDQVHGHRDSRGIEQTDAARAPKAERLQDRQQPDLVLKKEMKDFLQDLTRLPGVRHGE